MSKASRGKIIEVAERLLDRLELENDDPGCPVCEQLVGHQAHSLGCPLSEMEEILAAERRNYG